MATLVCAGITAYFTHHAVHGGHGLVARAALNDRATLVEFELESLEAVRDGLARDVALLSPEAPDPDLVEEIARELLGFVHPDDRVLRDPQPSAAEAR